MSDVILKAEGISKQYRLGVVGTGTLSHDLNRFWYRIRGKEDPYAKVGAVNDRSTEASEEYVWALRDINFEVKKGEVLGIIGKNGAGKSTLLKILSRVTGPTTGSIKTKGRIASLLEVGTGFHPELTGRENIYLNGAILGMTKAEVNDKIDEIIAFSGCQKYVDTPTKRYSSGMRVRLAFAVAAHLEPEILVIDEVLAVGDAEFQKKAIGKMQDISQGEGRTVLFVSHNMAAVKSLCTRAIVLENGTTVFEGNTDEAVNFYLNLDNAEGSTSLRYFDKKYFKDQNFSVEYVGIKAATKAYEEPITREDKLILEASITKDKPDDIVAVFRFKDGDGNFIFVNNSNMGNIDMSFTGTKKIQMLLPDFFFNEGNFSIDIMITNGRKALFLEPDAIQYTIIQEEKLHGQWMGKTKGVLKPSFPWNLNN